MKEFIGRASIDSLRIRIPSEKVKIVEPTKGKKISQEEYDEIMEKKMKEMRERYRHDREGDGQSFEIRIDG